jgi:hypothetical protein
MGGILNWISSSEEHNTCRADDYPFEHAFLDSMTSRALFTKEWSAMPRL